MNPKTERLILRLGLVLLKVIRGQYNLNSPEPNPFQKEIEILESDIRRAVE